MSLTKTQRFAWHQRGFHVAKKNRGRGPLLALAASVGDEAVAEVKAGLRLGDRERERSAA